MFYLFFTGFFVQLMLFSCSLYYFGPNPVLSLPIGLTVDCFHYIFGVVYNVQFNSEMIVLPLLLTKSFYILFILPWIHYVS